MTAKVGDEHAVHQHGQRLAKLPAADRPAACDVQALEQSDHIVHVQNERPAELANEPRIATARRRVRKLLDVATVGMRRRRRVEGTADRIVTAGDEGGRGGRRLGR